MISQGPDGMIGGWERLQVRVWAEGDSNVFLDMAVMRALGIPLALLVRARPRAPEPEPATTINELGRLGACRAGISDGLVRGVWTRFTPPGETTLIVLARGRINDPLPPQLTGAHLVLGRR